MFFSEAVLVHSGPHPAQHSLADPIPKMAPKEMIPNGLDASDWPCRLLVEFDMVQDATTSFRAMLEECPKVRFTVPLQNDVEECILEAVIIKSMVENIPNTQRSDQDTHDMNANINRRYRCLMELHEQLKGKVADARIGQKRDMTDEDVEEVTDTQPLADSDVEGMFVEDCQDSQPS